MLFVDIYQAGLKWLEKGSVPTPMFPCSKEREPLVYEGFGPICLQHFVQVYCQSLGQQA